MDKSIKQGDYDIGGEMQFQEWIEYWGKRIQQRVTKERSPLSHTPVDEAAQWILESGFRFYRPLVCLAAVQSFDADPAIALWVACSLQVTHCASLIIDDLPSFDDSAMRREKSSCHVRFGEPTAILASHLLLAQADMLMLNTANQLGTNIYARLRLANASTLGSMIEGQWMDISVTNPPSKAKMRAAKTGALYAFSAVAGGLIAGADGCSIKSLRDYGRCLGTAYQIFDDLRDGEDVPGDSLQLANCKREALDSLQKLGRPTPLLKNLLDEIVP